MCTRQASSVDGLHHEDDANDMPTKKPKKPPPAPTKAQQHLVEQFRAHQAAGTIRVKELPQTARGESVVQYQVIATPSDVVTKLRVLGMELRGMRREPMSELLFTALTTVYEALRVSEAIASSAVLEPLDGASSFTEPVMLALLALRGYRPPDDRAVRAEIHDFLYWNATEGDFVKLPKTKHDDVATTLARALAIRSGKGKLPNTQIVLETLRRIDTRTGRKKGTKTGAAPSQAATRKWEALHKLYWELGVSGPTVQEIPNEIRKTKSNRRVPRGLREL